MRGDLLRPDHPGQPLLGLTLWCAWFVVLYATLSLGCEWGNPSADSGGLTPLNGLLALITLAGAGLMAALAWRCWRALPGHPRGSQSRLLIWVSALAHGIAALTALWVGFPTILLPPCL